MRPATQRFRRLKEPASAYDHDGTLKTCHGFPHGMPTTEAETINADLLTFIRS